MQDRTKQRKRKRDEVNSDADNQQDDNVLQASEDDEEVDQPTESQRVQGAEVLAQETEKAIDITAETIAGDNANIQTGQKDARPAKLRKTNGTSQLGISGEDLAQREMTTPTSLLKKLRMGKDGRITTEYSKLSSKSQRVNDFYNTILPTRKGPLISKKWEDLDLRQDVRRCLDFHESRLFLHRVLNSSNTRQLELGFIKQYVNDFLGREDISLIKSVLADLKQPNDSDNARLKAKILLLEKRLRELEPTTTLTHNSIQSNQTNRSQHSQRQDLIWEHYSADTFSSNSSKPKDRRITTQVGRSDSMDTFFTSNLPQPGHLQTGAMKRLSSEQQNDVSPTNQRRQGNSQLGTIDINHSNFNNSSVLFNGSTAGNSDNIQAVDHQNQEQSSNTVTQTDFNFPYENFNDLFDMLPKSLNGNF